MRYFSLFSGVGGFELGINQVLTPECVGFSETNKYASTVYTTHFSNHKGYGDVTKINWSETSVVRTQLQ